MVNGIDEIALTKLDVLDGFGEIKVCTGYSFRGKPLKSFPLDLCTIEDIEPIYETVPGWNAEIAEAKSFGDLPPSCRSYVEYIEKYLEAPVKFVSVGATREQTITR